MVLWSFIIRLLRNSFTFQVCLCFDCGVQKVT